MTTSTELRGVGLAAKEPEVMVQVQQPADGFIGSQSSDLIDSTIQ